MPFQREDYQQFDELPPKPDNFDDMLEIATKLCKNIDFLRVDMYNLFGKIYFSELTFSPCSGMMPFKPKEWDRKVGNLLNISHYKEDE